MTEGVKSGDEQRRAEQRARHSSRMKVAVALPLPPDEPIFDVEYWTRALAERPEAIELPSDLPRAAIRDPAYLRVTSHLTVAETAHLTEEAARAGVSLNAIQAAAFVVFLGKIASTRDFTLGRGTVTELAPQVIHLDAKEPFSSLAARLDAENPDGAAHPFEVGAASRALALSPDPSRHPFFGASFGGLDVTSDLHARVLRTDAARAGFELTYDASLFSVAMAESLVRAYTEVLRAVSASLSVAVGDISLLGKEARAHVLEDLSTPVFNWPQHFLLHELFEAKVDQAPNATALVFAGKTLTYAELERRANVVAAALVATGIGPDAVVALVHERTPDMIVALLAVLKAGGAYLPIEPETPVERVAYILSDSGAKAVLTTTHLAPSIPRTAPILCVDDVLKNAARAPQATRLVRRAEPANLAYVIYTSGSTGQPKGVLIEHRNVVHLVLAEKADFDVRGNEALILLSSYTFDASVDQIWLALTSGAKLVLVDRDTLLDVNLLANVINDEQVTHLDTVPSLLASLSPETCPTVRRVVVGGETCPTAIARAWCDKVRFYNEYGPTETTVGSLRYVVRSDRDANGRVPIGRPIGMTRVYVLDWGGRLAPIGIRGELHLGGAGVARGYLHRDDLTRERFLPDPHAPPGGRMYRTGDMVAWLPDGNLEFFGRADSQVKIRGFRIELGEIEAALLTHPDVMEAAASVFGPSEDTRRLACHFAASRVLTKEELVPFLARALPSYMLPDAFVQLAELPKSIAGKVDRKKLAPPRMTEGPVDPPATQVESALRDMWCELLKLPAIQISVTKSFFELGGQSLLVMQLVAKIQRTLGVVVRAARVLNAPTIRQIAGEVAAADPPRSLRAAPRVDSALALPATSVQRRMYVIQQGNPRSTSYNLPLLYEIDGALTEDAVARACAALLERHESLRTAFFFQEGQILQKIAQHPRFKVERYEVSEDGSLDAATAAFIRPFILEGPPLFRAAVILQNGAPRFLALDMHHIVADGLSIDTLMEDLVALLRGDSLPSVALRYFDYATWVTSDAGRARLDASRAHWARLLKDELPTLDLPYDFRRPTSRQQTAGDFPFEIDRETMTEIAGFSREHGATPFAFFAAVYSVFLSCLTGSEEAVFGYPSAGRPSPDFERVVGMFVNTLVFRGRVAPDQSFADFLKAATRQIRESLENEDYPFEDLVEDLRLQPAAGHNPVFDTMLSYEGITAEKLDCGSATLREKRLPQRVARMDLVLVVRETAAGYVMWFEYSADLFKKATVEHFARALTGIVKAVLENANVQVTELQTTTPQERGRILHGFNATAHALPAVRAAHELFERHADSQPGAIAVAMADLTLTYAEVEARANALARVLRDDGVGRDAIVGILLDPCMEMLVSVLAVLKAGAGFMPIDPDYPAARKSYMLSDSRTRVLLTRGDLADGVRGAFGGRVIDLADGALYAQHPERVDRGVERADLAYVIYTSGSTGQPKGVQIEHRNLLNFASWYASYFQITRADGVSKYAGFGFDASISEMVPAWIAGARLVVVPSEIRLSIEELDQYFADHKVTVAFLPTQFGEQFLRHGKKYELRAAFLGGEKLRTRPTDRCIIINGYGPTEYTVAATAFRVDDDYDNIPIGAPVWNTQIVVLDRMRRVCPVGVAGELCISGASTARGYLNQPALTAEKFVDNPVSPGRRMYRTGDLARWRSDGNLEFLGRIDTQVKVRGFRIELGEIEQALLALPGVGDATVLARESGAISGDLTLVAFVTAASGVSTESEEDRKAALAQTLPAYMVPSRIVELAEIPMTANGKVDKRRLPDVELEAAAVSPPATSTETELREVYARVLGLQAESISVEASFLSLGGHSLKAAVLLSAIYQEQGLQLRLATFLEASSVRDVARVIDAEATGPASVVRWEPAPPDRALPLTSSQSRIFAVNQLSTWSTAYNIPFAWELDSAVDLEKLALALTELVPRHDALRASFAAPDGIPLQTFHDDVKLEVTRLGVDDANLQVTLDHFVEPFDLARAPLMRTAIIKTETRAILALDLHHIVADGLSVRILLEDLEALYLGELGSAQDVGPTSSRLSSPATSRLSVAKPTTQLGPSFADYVWWEQSAAAQRKRDTEKIWWLEKFASLPDQLQLPYDFDRPPRLSFDGDEVTLDLPSETAAPLLRLAKARGVTPLSVFFAAWSIVLARLGNTPDLVIGVPASGRHAPGTERLVGMFVNTVPLRVQLDADEEFSALCARLGGESVEAFERQAYQLNELVRDLGLTRDPSRNPVFDVLLAWEDDEIVTMDGSSLGLFEIPPSATPCKFDLDLTVQNTFEGLRLKLIFSTKLFRRATGEKFMGYLRRVLEQAARSPDVRVRELRMLQPWEREMLLNDFNRTDVAVPENLTLIDLFARHVAERPGAIAVEDETGSYTFAELDQKSSALGRALASRGVVPDDVVALSMGRTRELFVGILGILKAGAGYLPIDPEAPNDRALLMLEDSGARLLLTEGPDFGAQHARVLCFDAVDFTPTSAFPARAFSSGVAYVIYTSGSTGKPKGVVIEHRHVVNFLVTSVGALGITPEDRSLLFSSFTFDASIEQYGVALVAGGTIIVPKKETLLDLEAFEAFIVKKRVTHLDTVPLFLSSFTPQGEIPLKRVVVGGDICPVAVAERWRANVRFLNEYGPTETTITALRHEVTPDDLALQRLPIGRPVANTRIYILDWTRNLAPLGVPGEMYIGGSGVARGYLNNPELTAEKFSASPYIQGDRLYRTGDLARWTRYGTIDFLGRADNQVKIRGFRIELGEIEAALSRHPTIAEAAVAAFTHGENKRLCAFVVPRSGSGIEVAEIRTFLARALPSYMVPDAIVSIAALPVTTSGKVDRKKLPEPTFDASADADAPKNGAEEKLLTIWSEVLKVDAARIPLERSFFELGGHSLLIMLLIARIHQAFGVRFTPADVFDHPTIRGISALLPGRERQAIVPIPKLTERAHYPLSSVQRRLFAINQMNPESVSYNMPTVFAVDGRVTRERLEEVVRALFQRHAAFRTTFAIVDGEPVARIQPSVPFSMELIETDEDIDDLMARLVQPFDLTVAPLARIWLVRRSSGFELLVVDFHHIVMDGYSAAIIWREVSEVIKGITLAPLRIHYGDFAAWQEARREKGELAGQREFWLEQFKTLPPPVELPFDYRRPAIRNNAGDLVVVKMSKAELGGLTDIARKKDATLFTTVLSCYFTFLARISGSSDLVVGVPASGRVHPDIQELIGMFVNTVPWRAEVPRTGTFLDFLAATKDRSIAFLTQEEFQLEDLLNDLGVKTAAGHNPLFDVMFVFQARENGIVDAGKVKLHFRDFTHRTSKMDLVLIATESEAGLELVFEYPTELFARKTVERLAKHFVTLVRSILRDAEQPIGQLDILTEAEKTELLEGFNATAHDLPSVTAVHHLFADWVKKTPEAPAVVFGDLTWSYADVARKANAVATWLQRSGVKRGDFVAILLDPCAEQLPAILGVLEAGAAFLPIDSEYPVGRKSYMIEDSGARALLTRAGLAKDVAYAGPRLDLQTLDAMGASASGWSGASSAESRSASSAGSLFAAVEVEPHDAAYVIYTSGSTGKPKGVVVEHHNLVNFSLWYAAYYQIAPGDGVSKYAGFSFDASISEIFPACVSGAALVVVPAEMRLAPKELSAYFEATKTRVAFLPTQFGEQFLRLTDNHSLRMVALAGDKLRTYRPAPWTIINGYGPTEYTVCTTAFAVTGPFDNIPIGKPIWNTQVLVLDREGRLCPIGVPGELCVAGKGVARGYLNRPDLTAEKFVAHPFARPALGAGTGRPSDAENANARMYRTGDLARWLPDGNLEFLGRIDTQVKVRGFRIELGEIEQTLLDVAGIKDAVVVDAKDDGGEAYLIGYFVASASLEAGSNVSTQEPRLAPRTDALSDAALRAALARHLPDYMIPAHFCELPELPLTPNGKVDKLALPPVSHDVATAVVPAETAAEKQLARIWSSVLGVALEKIGVTTPFLDLGGHSLKAIALATEVYRELDVEIRVSDVFRHPTIRALLERIAASGKRGALGTITRVNALDPVPASSVQKRMFLLQRMDPNGVAYNVATLFRLAPSVTREALAHALDTLVARHDAFRATFFLEGAEPYLRVTAPPRAHAETHVPHVPHVSHLALAHVRTTEAERNAVAERLVQPFDLARGPLARAAFIETEGASYFFFDMHHIVTDGESMGLLVTELTTLLSGQALASSPRNLLDCTVWERSPAALATLVSQREHWRAVFADGVPALELLIDFPRPLVPEPEGETLFEPVPAPTFDALRDLAQKNGVSLFSLLLAAFHVFLARLTRQEEIVVGTPVSGRWHPDMQGVFGMFVNTLVLLGRPRPKMAFLDFAREVSRDSIAALDNQAFPFGDLVDLVGEPRRAGHGLLFDVMFVLQNADDRLQNRDETFTACAVENKTSKFDLSLVCDESKDTLEVSIEYRTSLFQKSTITRYLKCFLALLTDIAARPQAPLEALNILTAEDRELVHVGFNKTDVAYPPEVGAHRMFEKAVARFPDRPALVSGDRTYTYQEVDTAANRLAHRLRGLGVGRETIVAILTPPSCELIIAELATLKAGAAFLPLDHRYPRERLEYALRDSAARVLLSARGLDGDLDWPGARMMLSPSLFAEGPETPPDVASEPNDLAYVIYTSGSTGKPKGVAIEHASLVPFIQRTVEFYGLSENDRHSKYAGIGFDVSIIETFPPLSCGGSLHIVPEDIRLSPPGIAAWANASGITWMDLPTQLAEELIKTPRETKLRWLTVGGDRLRRYTPVPFSMANEYGPTESTVSATTFVVERQSENIPIGRPIANTKVLILDASGQLCPPGVAGEICLSGKGLARGYLGAPELTAKKFVQNALAGGRMYHTGDLGRWLEDGNIEFLGRIDSQVKIRGFRIELGEIEQAILEVTGVTGCVVIDRLDPTGDKMLCGYYVAAPDVTDLGIRSHLKQKLPDYMVPPALMRLLELPFMTSGKVDRKKLPEPIIERAARIAARPENMAEALVIAAFERSLGQADLGIDDDFFDFGGNSLKAVAVVAALAADFRITANDLFRLRTARNVAREIPMQSGDLMARIRDLVQSLRSEQAAADAAPEPSAASNIDAELARYRARCLQVASIPIGHREQYRNVLLTGATGFLGSHLLHGLLTGTDAKVHVTMRAKSRKEAWDRLTAKSAHYFGAGDSGTLETYRRRVILVLSDLSQPDLGVDRGTFDALARTVDCVIHSAALTKHYGDYSSFVAANVDATKNVIELARAASAHFNLISTTSVGAGDIPGKKRALFTELDCDIGQVAPNHYVRTKLDAEKAAIALRSEGGVANIFRVGFLTGDSHTLRFQENADDSGFVQQLKSYVALGRMPESALAHSFCPVDEVSDAILRLMATSSLLNETHHLDRALGAGDAARIMRANPACKPMEDASFYEWMGAHLNDPGVTQAATAVLLHDGLLDQEVTTEVITRNEKTEQHLARIGFQWSHVEPAQVWSLAGVKTERDDS